MTKWRVVRTLLAAAAYVLIAKVSQQYFVGPEVSAFFWPPSGFMLAMFLLSPRREWWVLVPVFFAANAIANVIDGDQVATGLGFGFANTAESLAAALLVTRSFPGSLTMNKLREVIGLAALAGVVSNAATALIGAAVVSYFFHAPFVPAWRVWWVADSVGMLLVTPVLLTWANGGLEALRSMAPARRVEGALLLGSMVSVAFFVFASNLHDASFVLPLPYATFPFLLWAAVRFGPRGGALASLLVAVIAVWFTVKGAGPFGATSDSTTQRVLSVQAFLAVSTLCSQMLAAVIDERRLADEALRAANAGLEERVQERTRELARSNAELEQFAYSASHDLKEPLRAVAGMTNLLRQRYQAQLDPKGNELMDHVIDGANRMTNLLNDLLAYSRVGARSLKAEPCSVSLLVKDALSNLATAVSESGAVVTYDELPTLKVDQTQMTQLFQNLIGNAIKFRGVRPPLIQVRAEGSGDDVKFTVRDNGIGIDQKYFEVVFGVFQRLHTRNAYPGNGIGLAICKKIVESHGGRIWMESEPGQGTSFFFTIPAAARTGSAQPTG